MVDDFIIIVDTREQAPYSWKNKGVLTICKKLESGDYSCNGFESSITIERKAPLDFLSSITHDRDRFKRELERMKAYERAYVLVESSLDNLLSGVEVKKRKQGKKGITPCMSSSDKFGISPASLIGTIASITVRYGVIIQFLNTREQAEDYCLTVLRKYWTVKRAGEL